MSNKRDLKAYIRYDGNGRVIPGALLLQRFKPSSGGKWHEIPAYECCNDITLALRILFYDIEFAIARVGDITNVDDWNTYFDLPALGNPFTSVEINGNEVKLYGGSNIKIKPALMYDEGNDIIELDDQAGCVTSVGGDAFSYSNTLTTVNLPECTILYGWQDSPEGDVGAFYDCDSLVNVSIPKVVTIGSYGFASNNSVTSINFPLLTTAGDSAFSNNISLTSVNLPSLVTAGGGCFSSLSSLVNLSLPALTTAGDFCFTDSGMITVSLPSLTTIGINSFYLCSSLTTVNLPQLLSVPEECFRQASALTTVNLNSATSIDPEAFLYCTALTSISLPSVINIESNSFYGCTSLTTISLPVCTNLGGTVGFDSVFDGISGNNITLTIPASRMTCDAGNPDGDIVYLQLNNTVTVVTV